MMGVMHDAESDSNKFRQTSLQCKSDIIQAAQSRVPGGALEDAVKLSLGSGFCFNFQLCHMCFCDAASGSWRY